MSVNRYAHITDAELLEKFKADGNNQYLGILLQRYTLLLLGVCMKYLKNEEAAKDGVQQIFLKCIAELQKYEVVYFKSWLYMVAKNYCLMKLRDKSHKLSVELKEELAVAETNDMAELVLKDKTLQLMVDSIPELNKEQQQCVTLFYLEKKSYQQVADATGFSLLQVKSYIQNGKRNLKMMIEKKLNNS